MMLLWSGFRLLALGAISIPLRANAQKHNVVVIMSDDQDMVMDSLSVMPNVKQQIAAQGTTYTRHYCTVSLCCPSRANFFTGRAAHNTNITSLSPPYGGWPKFHSTGLNDAYLPVWINESGISTYYVGKFMNSYSDDNFADPHPKGWKNSSFLVDPWTYNYFHSHWSNGYTGKIDSYPNVHTTSVTQKKALAMLDDAAELGDQFFMMIAPVAPHVQAAKQNGTRLPSGPPPPPKYEKSFGNRSVPRDESFNPKQPSGASWVYRLPLLTDDEISKGDEQYRDRLRNIAGVDDMVGEVISRLQEHNLLEDTYVIYTTDNGFHISQHRLLPGKRLGYETDINIPLLIRGPGVPHGKVSQQVHSHTDMAPTILSMLGVPLRKDFDGAPIDVQSSSSSSSSNQGNSSSQREYVNVEFWDNDVPLEWDGQQQLSFNEEGDAEKPGTYNNTYKSLRVQSANSSFYYSVWCDGSHEFYDMTTDYYQMNNLMREGSNGSSAITNATFFDRPAKQLLHRLDTLLLVLKSCKTDVCRAPWMTVFPGGEVASLKGAMSSKYDKFFASQPRVSFSECIPGHIPRFEGPNHVVPYNHSSSSSSSSSS